MKRLKPIFFYMIIIIFIFSVIYFGKSWDSKRVIGVIIAGFAGVAIAVIALYYLAVLIAIITKGKINIFSSGKYAKKSNEALKLLNDQCDPKAAIERYKQLIDGLPPVKSNRKTRQLLLNNLAASYNSAGDAATAVKIWEELVLEAVESSPNELLMKCLIHHNLANNYLDMGRIEDFMNELEIMKNFIREDNVKNLNNNIQLLIDAVNMKYAARQGEYEKPLAYYSAKFYEAKDLANKCLIVNDICLIYEKNAELEKLAGCLHFLAKNGKDLHIARAARDRLDKMPEQLRYLNMDISSILPPQNTPASEKKTREFKPLPFIVFKKNKS